MRRDSKLSDVLHILLHMAEVDVPLTSDTLAKAMTSNPVVVRTILAGLRKRGFVTSEKGHGGGWQLACDLNMVTLHDIYVAVGSPTMLALGNRTESPRCLVEQSVNTVMHQAFHDAEVLLLARFSEVTLAQVSQELQVRRREHLVCNGKQEHEGHHGHHSHHGGDHHVFTGIERWIQALEGPERDRNQRPDEVIAHLGLRSHDVVADIGAGTGYFAKRIAAAYPQVRVIAADAQPEMINYLAAQATERNLVNLVPVLVDPVRPELPHQPNLALLVDTLHHFHDRVAYLQHLTRSMAPGARIAVIDYTLEAQQGPPADHRIAAETVREELHQAGYTLELELNILPHQYFLIFKQRQ